MARKQSESPVKSVDHRLPARSGASIAGTFLLLILCMPLDPSRSGIPFGSIPALDLHNLYVFHHCELKNMPYGAQGTGVFCGDIGGRPMYYPPLLYWTFIWLRPLSFEAAVIIWRCAIVGGTLLTLVIWIFLATDRRPRLPELLFLVLVMPQFPLLFALERGNNDVWMLLLWTGAVFAFTRSRVVTAGALAGLAIVAKIYPIFACCVVAGVLIRRPRRFVRFLGGVLSGVLFSVLLFPESTLHYLSVLPEFASQKPPALPYSHGLPTHLGWQGLLGGGALILAWSVAGLRVQNEREWLTILAGALAISTFFSYTSYDYNLITIYPLMAVLFVRTRSEPGGWLTASLWILIVSVLGSREMFLGYGREKVLLQLLGLLMATMTVGRRDSTSDSAPEQTLHY